MKYENENQVQTRFGHKIDCTKNCDKCRSLLIYQGSVCTTKQHPVGYRRLVAVYSCYDCGNVRRVLVSTRY